ncbi:hypothetical protein CF326_g8662, partial [Tilletia indica]
PSFLSPPPPTYHPLLHFHLNTSRTPASGYAHGEEPVIYVSGRPFVLREASAPTETFGLSTRASNLESIERRLRADILKEAERNGGLVLVHEEDALSTAPNNASSANTAHGTPSSSSKSRPPTSSSTVRLTPTWIAVDETTVQTPRQVWDQIRLSGWHVSYHRIPIANEQAIENNYLDAYTEVLRGCDPLTTSVVANCGVGYVRTTFAMCAAVIVRRRQMMLKGKSDPLAGINPVNIEERRGRGSTVTVSADGPSADPHATPAQPRSHSIDPHATGTGTDGVARPLQLASAQQAHDVSVLKLLHVLSTTPAPTPSASFTFGGAPSTTAAGVASPTVSALHPAILIPTLISHPPLLNALRAANAGDYGVVRQLLGLLDDDGSSTNPTRPDDDVGGSVSSKAVVDWAINYCDRVLNLREAILQERLRYAVGDSLLSPSSSSDNNDKPSNPTSTNTAHLYRASKHLEKYLFLLAFTSYAYLDTVTPAELLEKEMAHPSENVGFLGLSGPGLQELEDDEVGTPEPDLEEPADSTAQSTTGVNTDRSSKGGRLNKSRRNRDGSEALSSSEQFVVSQPVFETIARGFNKTDMETIMPLQKVDSVNSTPARGEEGGGGEMGGVDEVSDMVQNRRGSILSAFTMLKSDFFVGIVKAGLKERIEGAPNLRGAAMILHPPPPTPAAGEGVAVTVQRATPTWSTMRRSESTYLGGDGVGPEGIRM